MFKSVILNKIFIFQKKKPSEPIYAEPSKPGVQNVVASSGNSALASAANTSRDTAKHLDETDNVTLRHTKSSDDQKPERKTAIVALASTSDLQTSTSLDGGQGKTIRHSDTQLLKEFSTCKTDDDNLEFQRSSTVRRFHSKSLSLSENRIVAAAAAGGSNLFHQNRELWEKRAELQSQQCLTTPRILTRNRIAPDLVMDLPLAKDDTIHNSRESCNGSDESSNSSSGESSGQAEDMTSAERFASVNQCTLKKNERYSNSSANASIEGSDQKKEVKLDFKGSSNSSGNQDKPKAEVRPQENSTLKELSIESDATNKSERTSLNKPVEDMLFIDENASTSNGTSSVSVSTASNEPHKSPIPLRNTQKFVSKFADLHLTGGCLSTSLTGTTAAATEAVSVAQTTTTTSTSQQQQVLSSFKPQVKVKPQILRKPLVLPPTTPEMNRRSQE